MTYEFMDQQQQQAVQFTFIRYEDYYIEDKVWEDDIEHLSSSTIYGKGNRITKQAEYVSKNDLLLSLLSLAQVLLPKYSLQPDIMLDQLLLDEDKPIIIDWCKRFGLPLPFDEVDSPNAGVGIDRFLEEIGSLHSAFQLWARLEFNDTSSDNEFSNVDRSECLRYLRVVHSAEAQLYIDYKNGVPQLCFSCDNLYDLARVQLLFQIASRESGTVYKCEECHNFFIRTHKSRTLCDTCRPLRYRRSRRNKKEASNNASKE